VSKAVLMDIKSYRNLKFDTELGVLTLDLELGAGQTELSYDNTGFQQMRCSNKIYIDTKGPS
jgi:hypothetical protein